MHEEDARHLEPPALDAELTLPAVRRAQHRARLRVVADVECRPVLLVPRVRVRPQQEVELRTKSERTLESGAAGRPTPGAGGPAPHI